MKIGNRLRIKAENTQEIQNLMNLVIILFLILWDLNLVELTATKKVSNYILKSFTVFVFSATSVTFEI